MEKIIHKAYKFRLYPNKEQETFINKSIGSCRFIYNYFLNEKTKYYTEHKTDTKKSLSFVETEHLLTLLKKDENYKWLKEINSQSLQFSLRNLDSAYSKFFNKLGGFPNFHKKRNGGNFTIPQFFKIVKESNKFSYIKIPKLNQELKFRKTRNIKGEILFCNISKTPTNKYFIVFTTKKIVNLEENRKDKVIGIDVGIKSFCVTSNNEEILNDKNIKRIEKRKKIIQRKLSKSKKGSNNRKKLVKKLARKYEKESDFRKDFLHQISHYFIENQNVIVTENLNVKGMIKNHKLAKSLSNQSFGEFFRQLDYKSNWNNKIYYQIDRWFPSSQIHNNCGYQNKNLKLSDRMWVCPNCGKEVDRDYNASLNIKDLGLADLKIFTVGTTESYASGRNKVTDFRKLNSVISNERRIPLL